MLELIKKLVQLKNAKINIQNLVSFLYTNNELLKREIKKVEKGKEKQRKAKKNTTDH